MQTQKKNDCSIISGVFMNFMNVQKTTSQTREEINQEKTL